MTPYYADESAVLYYGDCREVIPALELTADLIIADPPYGETSLEWDRWPEGWPAAVADATRSMWVFGSMRMFLGRRDEFSAWHFAQDVVWQKPRARGMSGDRFARVHEHVTHWYRGDWSSIYREAQRVPHYGKPAYVPPKSAKVAPGQVRPMASTIEWADDGTRLMSTVMQGSAGDPRCILHPTQKPTSVLANLIRYSCPPGGLVLDPFAGSGSTLDAARACGRRSVGVEAAESYCEVIARRLSQGDLFGGAA